MSTPTSASAPGTILGNILFVGPTRIATLIVSSFNTVLALEAARRIVRVIANLAGYSPQNRVANFLSRWTPEVITNLTRSVESPRDIQARHEDLRTSIVKAKASVELAQQGLPAKPSQHDKDHVAYLQGHYDQLNDELAREVEYKQSHKGITDFQLGSALVVTTVVSVVGWEFTKWLTKGDVSPWYNRVARCIGPLILDETYRHPLVQVGVDVVKNAFPRLK
jgi:hypothetical protein